MRRLFPALAVILCTPTLIFAQLISIKTVPVASGDQFMIFPSRNLAMGGVHIALDDPMADPFVNPAMGVHIQRALLFGAPTFYAVGEQNGSARTIPIGGVVKSNRLFGGLTLALQEISAPAWSGGWAWPMMDFAIRDVWPGWIPMKSGISRRLPGCFVIMPRISLTPI